MIGMQPLNGTETCTADMLFIPIEELPTVEANGRIEKIEQRPKQQTGNFRWRSDHGEPRRISLSPTFPLRPQYELQRINLTSDL
jgi:hypothetical protein